MRTVILLPPSEGKATGGRRRPWAACDHLARELTADRERVRDAVRAELARGDEQASRLLGVRGAHLERALAEWRHLDTAGTLAAGERYDGVVWGALDRASLDPAARRRLNARVLIPSGLWGLLGPGDPIPPYRLKMGARVAPIGSLTAFWRPRITPLVDARAAGGWIIDLLPDEHAAAIDTGALSASRRLRVELVEEGGEGERRAVGHAGKSLKGRLARAILESDARTPRAVAALRVPGLRAGAVTRTAGGATVAFTRVPGVADPPD